MSCRPYIGQTESDRPLEQSFLVYNSEKKIKISRGIGDFLPSSLSFPMFCFLNPTTNEMWIRVQAVREVHVFGPIMLDLIMGADRKKNIRSWL